MAADIQKRLSKHDYSVAIVCPLEVEASAMRYMLDEEHEELLISDDPNGYFFGEVSGQIFSFCWYETAGLGGGVPSTKNDIRLGDVVVSMPQGTHGGVIQYDLGKKTTSGFERKGWLQAPANAWRNAVVKKKSNDLVKGNSILENVDQMLAQYPILKGRYQYPGLEKDLLFPSNEDHEFGEETCEKCRVTTCITRQRREPKQSIIHYGLIASGNSVVKNAAVRDQLSKDNGGVLCFEMEAAGLMNDFNCIIVRGICDYADSHKNDEWHGYGAAVAAACAKSLLTYMPVVKGNVKPEKTYTVLPAQRVRNFIGRKSELAQIQSLFTPSITGEPRIVIINALGGQGKTQLALEYCHRSHDSYKGLFWINVSSEASLSQSFLQTTHELHGTPLSTSGNTDDVVRLVYSSIRDWKDRCLFVFDNCDDPRMFERIRSLLPTRGPIDVLITSRCKAFDRVGIMIDLDAMSPHEGLELLLQHYADADLDAHQEAGSRIVNRLGGLPLAIDQAAAYLKDRMISLDKIETFLEIYEKKRREVLRYIPDDFWEYGDGELSAFTTWELSLQHLSGKKSKDQAAMSHILTLSAFLGPTTVTENMFYSYWRNDPTRPMWSSLFTKRKSPDSEDESTDQSNHEQGLSSVNMGDMTYSWNHAEFQRFIARSHRLSLTQRTISDTTPLGLGLSLHPLIRDWLQLRQSKIERHLLAKEAQRIFVVTYQWLDFNDITAERRQWILSHADAILDIDEKYAEAGKRLGEDPQSCDDATIYAWIFMNMQQYEKALMLSDRTCKFMTMSRSLFSQRTFRVGFVMGASLRAKGDYTKAVEILRPIVAASRTFNGENDLGTIYAIQELSKALSELGMRDEATSLLRHVLSMDDQNLESPSVWRSDYMIILADQLAENGDLKEACLLYEQALQTNNTSFGPDHSETIKCRLALTLVKLRSSKLSDSDIGAIVADLQHAYNALRQKYGIGYDYTLVASSNLTSALVRAGRYQDAVDLGVQELNVREKLWGKQHPKMLPTMNCLATAFERLHCYHDAENLRQQGFDLCSQLRGLYHEETVLAAYALVRVLKALGKADEIDKLSCMMLRDTTSDKASHNDVWMFRIFLAQTMQDLGRHDVAMKLFEQVLLHAHRKRGRCNIPTSKVMIALAHSLEAGGTDVLGIIRAIGTIFENSISVRTILRVLYSKVEEPHVTLVESLSTLHVTSR